MPLVACSSQGLTFGDLWCRKFVSGWPWFVHLSLNQRDFWGFLFHKWCPNGLSIMEADFKILLSTVWILDSDQPNNVMVNISLNKNCILCAFIYFLRLFYFVIRVESLREQVLRHFSWVSLSLCGPPTRTSAVSEEFFFIFGNKPCWTIIIY